MGEIVSVNVGRDVEAEWAGRLKRTAIDKRSVDGRVPVGELGLAGDENADKENHGGLYQAVYAYAREDLDWWASRLGRGLHDGIFGENLTVSGIDVTGALLGERWRAGGVVLDVTGPRVPCGVFRNWMGEVGWVKRFTEAGRPGAYLRVLAAGDVGAGDRVEVVSRPEVRITVAESFRAYHGDRELMRRILELPDRSPKWDEIADHVLRS